MKIKFPSYVTRKFYLYLITLKFLKLGDLSFIKNYELLHWKSHLNLCAKFSGSNCDLPEFLAVFLVSLLISKTVFTKIITDRSKNIISVQLQGLLTGNVFSRPARRKRTLTFDNFLPKYAKSFLYTKWNIICETSMKMTIFNSNGSFYNFYPNLPKHFLYTQDEQK